MAGGNTKQSGAGMTAMTGYIDVHAHIVPEEFPMAPATCHEHWPWMAHHESGDASLMIGGSEFRKLDSRSWDIVRRIGDMDTQNVAIQVLSPMPELLSYWIDAQAALELSRHVNFVIADMVAGTPTRFTGLGMVPLQNPDLAAAELARIKSDGLVGVEIGSNILGRSPGDPFFDPFYAELERLDLCVFVHALHPVATERLVGPKALDAFIGFPIDTGLAAMSFITGRTLEKFPKLRIAFSHGGGTLASLLPRLQKGWMRSPALKPAFASPIAAAQRMFYDNIVFDPAWLRYLIDTFGDTQILAGSDYPYAAGQEFPGRPFAALSLDDEANERLRTGNAHRFLGLTAP